ncbi:MAG: SIR2 family protein, partial [Actinomycetota bacterium]|nr:SIR2 family protein [Actinomycetota bacterium]
ETVAMGAADTEPVEAARRLEVLLDLLGCLSTPPTGYLLDPAYRGLLNEEERSLSAALSTMAGSLPGDASSAAAQEVLALLRRLGHGRPAAGEDDPPADGRTDSGDERVQEQRPG